MSAQKNESSTAGCLIVSVLTLLAVGIPLLVAMFEDGGFGDRPSASSQYDPVFGARESGRLAERLAAASRTQNICYGWEIDSDRSFVNKVTPIYGPGFTPEPVPPGQPSDLSSRSVEIGSNLGVGVDPRKVPARCPRWVVFKADYYYSLIEEEWTSVTTDIESNLDLTLSEFDLIDFGISEQDLLGDNAGARLSDTVAVLPALVAEKGGAPRVTDAPAAQTPPPGDKLTAPGKGRYIVMGIAILLIAGGLVWIIAAAVRSRRS